MTFTCLLRVVSLRPRGISKAHAATSSTFLYYHAAACESTHYKKYTGETFCFLRRCALRFAFPALTNKCLLGLIAAHICINLAFNPWRRKMYISSWCTERPLHAKSSRNGCVIANDFYMPSHLIIFNEIYSVGWGCLASLNIMARVHKDHRHFY